MQKHEKPHSLLSEARETHVFSGFGFLAEHGRGRLEHFGGVTSYWPGGSPVGPNTYFDVGSLTKVLCTASVFARAVERGEVRLSDSLDRFLPEFQSSRYSQITLADLLAHCAGFIPTENLALTAADKNLLAYFLREQERILTYAPREKAVYSDLDYLLLGEIAKKLWGPLQVVFQNEIAGPLGMHEVRFGPIQERDRVAATEYCLDKKRLLHGEVFDPNSAFLDGICGHAGLFATVGGIAPFCREWLRAFHGKSSWLSSRIARLFAYPSAIAPGSIWGYGWDTPSPGYSSAGSRLSRSSFGHLGYPGCSVWLDPDREAFVIFLSNRVHPSRFDERIRLLRPKLHDSAAEWFDRAPGER